MDITLITEENIAFFAPFTKALVQPEEMPVRNRSMVSFGAIDEDTACGIIELAEQGEVTEICWIYVALAYREKGVATQLLDYVLSHAKQLGAVTFTCYYPSEGSYSYCMDHLLMRRGFAVRTERTLDYETTVRGLLKSPMFKGLYDHAESSGRYRYEAVKSVPAHVLSQSTIGHMYDFSEYTDLSIACLDGSDRLKGIFLVNEKQTELEIDLLMTMNAGNLVVLGLLNEACKTMVRRVKAGTLKADIPIRIQILENTHESLLKNLLDSEPVAEKRFHEMTL